MADEQQSTEALVRQVQAKIDEGVVSLSDLLKVVASKPDPLPAPAHLPLPAQITTEQRKALERLPEVFGQVVPVERRDLLPSEIKALYAERDTLDEIEKLAADRKAAIRTTVCNHLDVVFESDSEKATEPVASERDKDGHYVAPGKAPIPDTDRCFSREVRSGSPSLNSELLKALVEAGELDHEDYLEMTTQVRVVDENKVMLKLKKKPQLVQAIAKATTMGRSVASLYVRKQKA